MRPTVACCVIAKNEENNVKQWFESIDGCFDQIHFVDTGSTDNTVEIAKSLGCTVHHFDWVDDFSAARNYAFSKATTDFIFWMDLDDVLSSKKDFCHFRDNTMNVADYWLATYHYSLDASGNPNCSFARERVIRRSKGLKWTYFIHEGILPQSNDGECRMQFIPEWSILHKRTEDDLKKDKSRNLHIFEKHLNNLDGRMRFYYGKELFESGKHLEAYAQLKMSIDERKLEGHDLILAYQYGAFSAIQLNNSDAAIDMGMSGIKLDPNRAEYYVIIGDAHIKAGRLAQAIPFFNAARSCTNYIPPGARMTGPIFNMADAYGSYPTNQLARIYANLGDIQNALNEADLGITKYKNKESEIIKNDIKRVIVDTKSASSKPCEDIVISCFPSPYEWDADIAKKRAMGGSETAAIEMASAIRRLSGRPVKIFNGRSNRAMIDGVEYIPCQEAAKWFSENKPYAHIAWRHNQKLTDARTILWCHDLITPGAENTDNYDKILCLTPFHKNYLMSMQGVPEDKIIVTRNGIEPSRFVKDTVKNPYRIAFTSSPDRGLDRAMLVCDIVKEVIPEIELHVYYGYEHLHKYGLQALADKLHGMIKERPYVRYHGATQQNVLAEHLSHTAIWLYPSDWIETSCITAMEMLCAGVYPIVRKIGGVADTLAAAHRDGMCDLLYTECTTHEHRKLFADAIIDAIEKCKWKNVKVDTNSLSWESVAREWLEWL